VPLEVRVAVTSYSSRVVGEPTPSDFYEVWLVDWPVPIRIDYAAIRDGRIFRSDQEQAGLLLGASSSQGLHINRLLFRDVVEFGSVDRLPADAPQLLGFFRTNETDWPELRESDRRIARQYFKTKPHAQSVLLLLIHTPPRRLWSAQLFVLEAHKEGTQASTLPAVDFPFDENVLRHRDLTRDASGSDPNGPPGGRGRSNIIWMILASFIILSLVGMGAYVWSHQTRAPVLEESEKSRSRPSSPDLTKAAPDTLALKVNRSGNDFEVSWDRQSDAVRQAVDAALMVRDGTTNRTLRLDGAQLREGKILYSPLFDELNFRLEVVLNNHKTLAESVTVIGWNASMSSVTGPPAGDLTTALAPAFNPPPGKIPRKTPLAEPKQNRTPRNPDAPVDSNSNAVSDAVSNAVSNAPPESPQTKAPERPAPAAVIPPSPLRTLPVEPSPIQGRLTPPPQKPSVAPETPPARAAASTVPQSSTPSKVVQPLPVRKVTPAVSPNVLASLKSGGQGRFTISVEVAIDASGNVKNAEIVSVNGQALESSVFAIKAAALEAAKAWKFRPGSLDGRSVPSTSTIQFNFR
jgi:outer membrane biosynthesis protein TonB